MYRKIATLLLCVCGLYFAVVIVSVLIPPLFRHRSVETNPYGSLYSGSERVLCIDDNTDALVWRLRLIESAHDEIIISTHDWSCDESGENIMSSLLQAADRGVHIRILTDGINGLLKLKKDASFNALMASENVEVKYYNPIKLLLPWKWNYRLHDKYFITDTDVYILGGRNTGNLFLGEYEGRKNVDRDILVYEVEDAADSSLVKLRSYFEEMWQSDFCVAPKVRDGKKTSAAISALDERYETLKTSFPEAFTDVDWTRCTMEVQSIRLLTNPINTGNKEPLLWTEVMALMQAGRDITIQTPYVICSRPMLKELTALCDEDKAVTVITNDPKSGANLFGCADFLNSRKSILKTGMQVYTYSGERSQHTKTVLIDDNISVVGSFNFDMRSVYLDTEMMLVIESEELNAYLREQSEVAMAHSVHLLQNGEEEYGTDYIGHSMSPGKKTLYSVLRCIILPFRHLL